MPKRRYTGDVQWRVPNRKKPIAYSTKGVSELIAALSQEHETVQDVYNAIIYDHDAKAILRLYIDKGYGNVQARNMFR